MTTPQLDQSSQPPSTSDMAEPDCLTFKVSGTALTRCLMDKSWCNWEMRYGESKYCNRPALNNDGADK